MEPVVDSRQSVLPWASYIFEAWNLIIRPPRHQYSQSDLVGRYPRGHSVLQDRTPILRTDFTVFNGRGLKLACTIFEPTWGLSFEERACVVHCHGNSSSRLAGFELVPFFCPLNIAVACFDFAGSGWSEGDYVSLGFYEQEDLGAFIGHLRGVMGFTRIGIWGFSMGASTALMHTAQDASIAGVLADSPFNDLGDLITEICCNHVKIPSAVVNSLLPIVRFAILQKANFDIFDVSPSKYVAQCYVPALFLHGAMDKFISPIHSSMLESSYCGESLRIMMPHLTHACRRPCSVLERAAVFFVRALRWETFLPPNITEERLALSGQPTPVSARPMNLFSSKVHRNGRDQRIRKLLASNKPEESCLGLVLAACELCPAYQGAFAVPITGTCAARCPVSFAGQLHVQEEDAEVALCWVQESVQNNAEIIADAMRVVYFAVVSHMSLSVSRVTLVYASHMSELGAGLNKSGPNITCAGYACKSVEPIAFAEADLAILTHHEIQLRIWLERLTISVGGATICLEDPCADEEVHLCCVQWQPATNDGRPPSALTCILHSALTCI